jgi:steroid delta-isomerase-like uncharacterized protein
MPTQTDVVSATTDRIEQPSARQLDDEFVAGWNSHQLERLLSLMADDVVYEDSSWPTVMNGHHEIRVFLQSTWRAVPDLRFTHEDTVLLDPSGTGTARYWHGSGTHTGFWDPPGLKPTGTRFSFHGATFLESRGGKLYRIRVVYDVAGIMRQLGLLPGRATLVERLIMSAANLRTRLLRR